MRMSQLPAILQHSASVLVILTCCRLTATEPEYLVSDRATHRVMRYSVEDGRYLGDLVGDDLATNGGLFMPSAMVIGFEGDLFVTSVDLTTGDGRVLRYDAATGDFLETFATGITGPAGLFYHPPSDALLVGELGPNLGDSNLIARFTADGTRLPDLALGPVTGRTDIEAGPDGNLLVSSFADDAFNGSVLEYEYLPETNEFALAGVFAEVPGQLLGANGIALDADNDLYVASLFGQGIVKFDVEAGAVTGAQTVAQAAYPSGLLVTADNELLVTSLGNNRPGDPIYGDMLFPGAVFRYRLQDGLPDAGEPFLQGGADFQPTAILPRPLAGDYNGDGRLTAIDIDQLTSAVREGDTGGVYDLNQDGQVNGDDRLYWIETLKNTYVGDANLDGQFDSNDMVAVFVVGEYEDNLTDNSTWATGDWDGNGEFASDDIVFSFQFGGYEMGPPEAVIAIPEPSGFVLGGLALIGTTLWLRGRSRSGQKR